MFLQLFLIIAIFSLMSCGVESFFLPPSLDTISTYSSMSADLPPLLLSAATAEASSEYQIQFFVYLAFGSGPLLTGLSSLPQIRDDYAAIQSLAGKGTRRGGPLMDLNPLEKAFLPEGLCIADVQHAIDVCPKQFPARTLANPAATCAGSVEELQKYVSEEVFVKTLLAKKCNPLVADRLFQAFSGGTSHYVPVSTLNRRLEDYRKSPLELFAKDLGRANGVRILGFVTLVALIGVVVDLIAVSAMKGFL
eukprot:CAMPEP_0178897776 /NCGR_PEP_ID=MMETSP0786-20121207/1945_1 /TAXON_ID=186022 /ORGANISM="Thalassionema frauenfeldii, Strain CCMP 1798" /LENGTH=249 /DNA_ID=CAMNT_0020568385 /DNA_START=57 /DNA_END=806 /DNA_ORIENTATION=+